jgi:hypothetical protein
MAIGGGIGGLIWWAVLAMAPGDPEPAPAPEAPPVAVEAAAPAVPAPAVPAAPAASPLPVPPAEAAAPAPLPGQPARRELLTGAPGVDPASGETPDPWARPHFIKGDLNSFSVRPGPRRNFIGVAAGVSALPSNADAVINAFYLTVEPQIEIINKKYDWRLSLGAPLQFELADTRGAFEVCIAQARQQKETMMGTRSGVEAAAAACVGSQKDKITAHTGRLRKADWDEASDFAKIIRHLTVGGQEKPFYLSFSRLYDQSFGHGTTVRHYNPNIDYNTARLGANIDFSRAAVGVQAMANDLVDPDVVGVMGFLRPLRPFSEDILLRSLSLGLSWVRGGDQPRGLRYETGLLKTAFDQPIPYVDGNLDLEGSTYHQVSVIGVNLEGKVLRTPISDVKVYIDFDKMVDFDSGITVGSLGRFTFGQPATQALRARAELSTFGPAFMPSYFDTFHDIFQYQYLPAGYRASNGLTYFPTKLEFLEASRGGRRKIGGYAEVTHSILDRLTVGAVVRGWTAIGDPAASGYTGPQFPDFAKECQQSMISNTTTCPNKIAFGKDPGFSALRLTAEVPFRRYLQAFVSYEAFSSTTEGGLGAFQFDGDNEVFFSGARLMVLPFLFLQGEARRYFFLQRLSNVDLRALTFDQDQNFHSRWTFALNASLGYEF